MSCVVGGLVGGETGGRGFLLLEVAVGCVSVRWGWGGVWEDGGQPPRLRCGVSWEEDKSKSSGEYLEGALEAGALVGHEAAGNVGVALCGGDDGGGGKKGEKGDQSSQSACVPSRPSTCASITTATTHTKHLPTIESEQARNQARNQARKASVDQSKTHAPPPPPPPLTINQKRTHRARRGSQDPQTARCPPRCPGLFLCVVGGCL